MNVCPAVLFFLLWALSLELSVCSLVFLGFYLLPYCGVALSTAILIWRCGRWHRCVLPPAPGLCLSERELGPHACPCCAWRREQGDLGRCARLHKQRDCMQCKALFAPCACWYQCNQWVNANRVWRGNCCCDARMKAVPLHCPDVCPPSPRWVPEQHQGAPCLLLVAYCRCPRWGKIFSLLQVVLMLDRPLAVQLQEDFSLIIH